MNKSRFGKKRLEKQQHALLQHNTIAIGKGEVICGNIHTILISTGFIVGFDPTRL